MPKKLRARVGNKPVRKKTNSEPLAEGIRKPRPRGFFTKMSDDELVKYASKFIEKNEIKSRSGLKKEDSGLYKVLRKRELLDRLKFEKGLREKRNWASMSDKEIVDYAKGAIKEKGIKSRGELEKEDTGLYNALRKRKLLDRLKFERTYRKWAPMSDDELVEHARKFIEEKGIKNRKGLQKEETGLYHVLWKRKLLDKLEFEKKLRNWTSISDTELVEYAKKFIKEKEIKSRGELEKEDTGLYQVLRKRKLLNHVFSDMEQAKEKQAVQDVFDALREFGGPG